MATRIERKMKILVIGDIHFESQRIILELQNKYDFHDIDVRLFCDFQSLKVFLEVEDIKKYDLIFFCCYMIPWIKFKNYFKKYNKIVYVLNKNNNLIENKILVDGTLQPLPKGIKISNNIISQRFLINFFITYYPALLPLYKLKKFIIGNKFKNFLSHPDNRELIYLIYELPFLFEKKELIDFLHTLYSKIISFKDNNFKDNKKINFQLESYKDLILLESKEKIFFDNYLKKFINVLSLDENFGYPIRKLSRILINEINSYGLKKFDIIGADRLFMSSIGLGLDISLINNIYDKNPLKEGWKVCGKPIYSISKLKTPYLNPNLIIMLQYPKKILNYVISLIKENNLGNVTIWYLEEKCNFINLSNLKLN